MNAGHQRLAITFWTLGIGLYAASGLAQDDAALTSPPPWVLEVKTGRFEPDLDGYERFYADEEARTYAISFAYRFKPWLEVGSEIAYARDQGFGIQSLSGMPGGTVKYTLIPARIFVNFLALVKENQLAVPYVSVGATRAYYKQDVELQSEVDGRTDLGAFVRIGIQLSMDRLDPGTANRRSALKRTYLFFESQRFTSEVDNIDLGGDAYVLGIRFEFGKD